MSRKPASQPFSIFGVSTPRSSVADRSALRVALIFGLFGVLWIFLSDYLVERGPLATDAATAQTIKGLVFVGLSAGLIFLVSRASHRALALTGQRLADVQRISHTGDWWFDVASGESRVSDEMYRIMGVSVRPEGMDLGAYLRLIHPDDRPAVDAAVTSSIERSEPFQIEHRALRADGSVKYLQSRGEPWHRADGTVGGLYGTSHDITDRRTAEERLRFLSRAVEQSPTSIMITDPTGDIVYVNPKFCEVTGYDDHEVLGRNPRLLKSGVQDDAFYRTLWETITGGHEWRGEMCNRRRDGTLLWEVAAISPVVGPDGEITHYVAVKEDVTEHRLLQKKFEEAQKMDAVGRLAGGIAHDFNNVLTAIGGHAELLLDEVPAGHALRADVEEIVTASERAGGVIRQLLHFSRQGSTRPTVVDLNTAVERLHRMLERLLGSDVRLEVETPAEPSRVRADRAQIDQILVNLAINARDAMPGGGTLRIVVDAVEIAPALPASDPTLDPGDYIRLRISDTGTGMTDDVKPFIFEPFFSTKDPGKGTGLGLATVFGMMQQNGGQIDFQSELGHGTTFVLHFPAVSTDDPAVEVAPATDGHPETDGGPRPRSEGEVVLVVEDESPVRSLVRRVLAGLGYQVIEAADGQEAEHAATTFPGRIDLLLTDTVMPGMRGPEVARRVRAVRPHARIAFMSGYTYDEATQDVTPDIPFLAKPFTPDDLARFVHDVLREPADDGRPAPT